MASLGSTVMGDGAARQAPPVVTARQRANKNNVKMNELDAMLENDAQQLVGMKRDIATSQQEQVHSTNKMLIAQRKEYDLLRRTNVLKSKEESAWADRVQHYEHMVQSGKGQQSKYGKRIEQLNREVSKAETIIATEMRSQRVLEAMHARIEKEISDCRVDMSSASFALDHLRHEFTATDLALISSKQDLAELQRQISTLTRTADVRAKQRVAKLHQLQVIVDEGETSRQKMEESVAEQSSIISQRETWRAEGISPSGAVDAITGTRRPQPGGISPGGATGTRTGTPHGLENVFFEVSGEGTQKVAYKQVLAMIEHYTNKDMRRTKLKNALTELGALGKRLAIENATMEAELVVKEDRLHQLSSNRQIYHEMDSKDNTLTTARKDCDEFLDRGRGLQLSIESLRSTLPRLLTKLTKTTHKTVEVDALHQTLNSLDEEVIKTMKSIGQTLMADATNEDIAEAAEKQGMSKEEDSELELLLKLPGFFKLQNTVFANLMKARSDDSGKNVRIHVDGGAASPTKAKSPRAAAAGGTLAAGQKGKKAAAPKTDHEQSTTSISSNSSRFSSENGDVGHGKKNGGKKGKGSHKETVALDKYMVKNISKLIVERDRPKTPPPPVYY